MRQHNSGGHNKWPRARTGGGGRRPHNTMTKTVDSNGPNVKVRGTLSHICRRYQALARDAQAVGDRIRAENFLQHAEHYYRLLSAAQSGGGAQSGREGAEAGPEGEGEATPYNGHDTHLPESDIYPVRSSRPPRADHDRHDRQGRHDRQDTRQDRSHYNRRDNRQDDRPPRGRAPHRGNEMPGLPPAVSAPQPVRYEPKPPPASEESETAAPSRTESNSGDGSSEE